MQAAFLVVTINAGGWMSRTCPAIRRVQQGGVFETFSDRGMQIWHLGFSSTTLQFASANASCLNRRLEMVPPVRGLWQHVSVAVKSSRRAGVSKLFLQSATWRNCVWLEIALTSRHHHWVTVIIKIDSLYYCAPVLLSEVVHMLVYIIVRLGLKTGLRRRDLQIYRFFSWIPNDLWTEWQSKGYKTLRLI